MNSFLRCSLTNLFNKFSWIYSYTNSNWLFFISDQEYESLSIEKSHPFPLVCIGSFIFIHIPIVTFQLIFPSYIYWHRFITIPSQLIPFYPLNNLQMHKFITSFNYIWFFSVIQLNIRKKFLSIFFSLHFCETKHNLEIHIKSNILTLWDSCVFVKS